MSFNTNQCPVCQGDGETKAFVHGFQNGRAFGGLRSFQCKTCEGKGWLHDWELGRYNEIEGKHKQRKAVRLAHNLSMREMAKKVGVDFLRYNDYEHGRIDLPEMEASTAP